ncbi:metal-dependent transcriptional regulator [Candidatus Fermentibacteria bacterium]|nr:metal-dependent transcriptional regulator [Candidatus Fermentibacteria bacterium]
MEAVSLSASLEDYLEAIYQIVEAQRVARPRDITRRLRVGSSSVTGALHALAERGMIDYAPHDLVTLTPQGEQVAKDIVRRHESLREFLVKVLGVEPGIADESACKMEHALSRSVSDRFTEFVRFVERCPWWGDGWIERFRRCTLDMPSAVQCTACIESCLRGMQAHGNGKGGSEISTRPHE